MQFDELCKQVNNILEQYQLGYLSSILQEKNPILQPNKGQLLNYLISVIDYLDFQYAINEQWRTQNESDEIKLIVDVGKIATNFGLQADSKYELIEIIRKKTLRQKLKEVFNFELDKTAKENVLLEFIPTGSQTVIRPDDFRKYNQAIEEIIYNCGVGSENRAVKLLQHSYDFVPSEYQNYSISLQNHNCYDGILSFRDIIDKINKIESENSRVEPCVVQYLSAYIALMDNGILSTRLQFTEGTDKKLVTILKAGELSTFFVPRRIAVFIPAFAKVSYYSSRFGLTQKEAVNLFYQKYYESVNGTPYGCKDVCSELFDGMCINGCWIPSPMKVRDMTDVIYDCGQTYSGWNFKNMTWQTDNEVKRFQETLLEEAELFISRGEKYWE